MGLASIVDTVASPLSEGLSTASGWAHHADQDALSGSLGLMSAGAGAVGGIAKMSDGDWANGLPQIGDAALEAAWAGTDLESAAPIIGGLGEVASGAGQAAWHHDQADDGYFANEEGGRNEFYGSLGDVSLGGSHLALQGLALGSAATVVGLPEAAVFEEADLMLETGETIVDGVGLGAGLARDAYEMATGAEDQDWYFGAGDVVGLGVHGGVDLADAIIPGDLTGALSRPVGVPAAAQQLMDMWA